MKLFQSAAYNKTPTMPLVCNQVFIEANCSCIKDSVRQNCTRQRKGILYISTSLHRGQKKKGSVITERTPCLVPELRLHHSCCLETTNGRNMSLSFITSQRTSIKAKKKKKNSEKFEPVCAEGHYWWQDRLRRGEMLHLKMINVLHYLSNLRPTAA